jgi:hypothetical protein
VSTATLGDLELLVVVPEGASEEEWQDGRADGVTASEIHGIAAGSRKTWRRILDGKLNGSTFHGNKHTRRGHEREPYILAEARILDGVLLLTSSAALFGNQYEPLHRATPDGFGVHSELGEFGVEVKNHHEDWTFDGIPADHFDQMQWGMHVTGLSWWLYAWAVEGVDGIEHAWVPRDDKRIAQLVAQADAFLAWRAAGAPEIDDIPDDVDDHLAAYAAAQRAEAAARREKEAHGAEIKKWAAAQAPQEGEPLRKSGSQASLFFEPKPDARVLDEDAWAAAEPESFAEWQRMRAAVAETAGAALALYSKPKPVAASFRITPNGDAS